VLSPERNTPVETDCVNQLFSAGLQFFHLRKPHASFDQIKNYIEAVDRQFRNRVILHSYYELVEAFGLKGVHLNSWHKHSGELPYGHRSVSCHSIEEVERAGDMDYIMLSPVFDSISKKGYQSAFDRNELEAFLKKSEQQVIALGGVNGNNIKMCKEMGFGGVAVLGGVWQTDNPVKSFKQMNSLCQE